MSWHFSQALVVEYSGACSADSELFAELKSSDFPATYSWHDRTTEHLTLFQFGMMSEPSTANLGEELLTWFRADSHAKKYPLPARCGDGQGSRANVPGYGGRTCELLKRYSRSMFSVKTRQLCESLDLGKSLTDFPPSGIRRGGSLLEVTLLDLIARDGDCGSTLPAPTARDWKDTFGMATTRSDGKTRLDRLPMLLFEAVRDAGISFQTNLDDMGAQTATLKGLVTVLIKGRGYCPELPEWLMAWPIGWTELKPLATGKFQRWLRLHGIY